MEFVAAVLPKREQFCPAIIFLCISSSREPKNSSKKWYAIRTINRGTGLSPHFFGMAVHCFHQG
jgi:hypothetical protein